MLKRSFESDAATESATNSWSTSRLLVEDGVDRLELRADGFERREAAAGDGEPGQQRARLLHVDRARLGQLERGNHRYRVLLHQEAIALAVVERRERDRAQRSARDEHHGVALAEAELRLDRAHQPDRRAGRRGADIRGSCAWAAERGAGARSARLPRPSPVPRRARARLRGRRSARGGLRAAPDTRPPRRRPARPASGPRSRGRRPRSSRAAPRT